MSVARPGSDVFRYAYAVYFSGRSPEPVDFPAKVSHIALQRTCRQLGIFIQCPLAQILVCIVDWDVTLGVEGMLATFRQQQQQQMEHMSYSRQ